ncbi:MAG: translation elongation factor Ts [Candidatus Chisholmbacteria bacterium]|nr:translation elongation factor Ts [Candidatus Chisholmbacteria bacterium]
MDEIKRLREKTGAGVMDAKRALEEASGDMTKAEEIIRQKGLAKAEKKAGRETKEGLVYAYVHHDGRSGAMVELQCETDFVARSDAFKDLAKELAMQVVSMEPKDTEEFLGQEYIRDPQLTVKDVIAAVVGKVGENIKLKRFVRLGLGEE